MTNKQALKIFETDNIFQNGDVCIFPKKLRHTDCG